MRYTKIFALAIGNVGAAQFSTSHFADTMTSAIDASTPVIVKEAIGTKFLNTAAGGIGTPDGFKFLGCFSSENDFPSFTEAYSSEDNDAYSCAEACFGNDFFGLYDNSCYCGSELAPTTSPSVSASECDIPCPGDAGVSCGGFNGGSRVMRRQVDTNVLLSIYVAVGGSPDETGIVIKTLRHRHLNFCHHLCYRNLDLEQQHRSLDDYY